MHIFWLVFCAGGFFFYFIDQAVDIDSFSKELIINNLYHFFTGFIFFIGMIHFKLKFKFKFLFPLVIGVLILGEVYDYFSYDNDFSLLTLFYNSYLLFWGAMSGLAFSKCTKPLDKKPSH